MLLDCVSRVQDGDPNHPIHFKAFDKADCLGHRVIRTADDLTSILDDELLPLTAAPVAVAAVIAHHVAHPCHSSAWA
jgi:hypothetical protein